MVSFDDFKKLDIRVAEIKSVEDHSNADKLYVVKVDIGAEERTMVAGIKNFYKPEELVGRKVIAIVNLEPATIRGVESQGMILAAKDANGLTILATEKDITTGSKIS